MMPDLHFTLFCVAVLCALGEKGFSIIEICSHWVGFLVVLMEDVEVEVLWPPILV